MKIRDKIVDISYLFVMIIFILFIIFTLYVFPNQGYIFKIDKPIELENLWHKENTNEGERIISSNVLFDKYGYVDTVGFRTYQEKIKVYLDDELIYRYGYNNIPIGDTPGDLWNIVTLPKDYKGKELRIVLEDPYSQFEIFKSNKIFIGTRSSIVLNILKENIFSVFLSSTCFIMGISFFILYFASHLVRQYKKSIVYIAILCTGVSIWTLSDASLLQMITDKQFTIYCIKLLLVAFIPITFIMIVIGDLKEYISFRYDFLVICQCAAFVLIIILQLLNILDLKKSLFMAHIIGIVAATLAIILLCKEYIIRKNKIKFTSIAYIVVILCGIIDIVNYNICRTEGKFFYTKIGVFALITFLFIDLLNILSKLYKESIKIEALKELAYIDTMTGTENRTCFQIKLEELDTRLNVTSNIYLVIFDINNLKVTNDTLGHQKGDELIIKVAKIIKATFGEKGEIFRIGGDEFVVILEDITDIEMEKIIKRFEYNVNTNKISIAYGCGKYNRELNKTMNDLFKYVDNKMYARKKEQKSIMH
ncbi:GGDEF domain-containing protein [Clostridium bornimense]|uniref:GGDEF domain-containing protein n=1 Tax=Clostridium bornimense TaxID=1216932 RepID=UPI001C127253|nr:GGDEF domain-containing protein [Clostridium bornimense]MBU5317345.1 GGDEF domain-containing protein [Clostridium bornimense]